ncbi:hypothetical protein CB1_001326004 [Camelus ferus]|nr:hypothetical protein CB1_001326004 [Camelus ferus]
MQTDSLGLGKAGRRVLSLRVWSLGLKGIVAEGSGPERNMDRAGPRHGSVSFRNSAPLRIRLAFSLKQDILNEKTELEATFKEAEIATCSVELLLPLFKETIEEISFENVEGSLSSMLEKLTDNESENANLKKKLLEKETCIQELSCLFQNEKMRGQMESHLKELEHVRDSLTAAEQRLHECQESLQHCKGKCADQAHTVDGNHNLLTKLSLEEENYLIQLKCENLQQKLEQMDAENKELEKKLANQEEYLKHSNLKFKEKSAEYTALARQLEAALEEGRQKVQMAFI